MNKIYKDIKESLLPGENNGDRFEGGDSQREDINASNLEKEQEDHKSVCTENENCALMHQLVEDPHTLKVNADEYEKLKGIAALDKLVQHMKGEAKEFGESATHKEHEMKCLLGHRVNRQLHNHRYSCEECSQPHLPRDMVHECTANEDVRERAILNNENPNFFYRRADLPKEGDEKEGEKKPAEEPLRGLDALNEIIDKSIDQEVSNRYVLDEWKTDNIQTKFTQEGNNFQVFNKLFKNIFIRWDKDFLEQRLSFTIGDAKEDNYKLDKKVEGKITSEILIFDEEDKEILITIEIDTKELTSKIDQLKKEKESFKYFGQYINIQRPIVYIDHV